MIRKVKSLLLMCMAVMALFAVTLFGCTDNDDKKDGGEVSVVSIALNEDALTLTVGQTATLEVTVLPGNATDKSVSWYTSAAAVATVSNGVVNAVAAGQAVITVTSAADSSITASCTVTVTAAVSHTHTFDKQVAEDEYLASAATCTEAATYYYSCECGEKGSETFAYGEPAGHATQDVQWSSDAQDHWKVCPVCNEQTEKSAHSWDEGVVTTPATHTSAGEMTYACTVCGKERTQTIPETTEHTYNQQVATEKYLASAATCTEAATYYYSCECGEKGSETFAYGEPAGHSYGEWQIPEDIGDMIYSGQSVTLTRTCTVCQEGTDGRVQTLVMAEVIDEKENPDANFILDSSKEWGMLVDFVRTGTYETTPYNGYFVTAYVMPDCTKDGMISGIYKSEEFGDVAFENIPMSQLEHIYSDWMADETQHWVYCYRCGNEFNHSPHSWDDGVVTTPATHMSEGTMTYTCTVCNSTRLEIIPATTEHDYSQQVIADEYLASAATCTEAATYYYSCECGEKGSETFAYGEPLGHDYVLDKDESGHWEECSACHAQTEKQPHVFGDGETCSECGYEREHGVTGVEAVLHTQNSQRQTQLVQTLFNINDVFNYTNLAVEATIVTAGVESKQYVEGFTVSAPDMTTAGQKQVTVTYEGKTTTYNITVLDLNGVPRNSASVTVDKNAVVGVSGSIVTVNSINDAVTVFKLLGTDDNVTKVINVAAGEYYEKVEIDIPKVELVGGTTNAADTVIWYDLIAAIVAPGTNQGYSTDGAATVSIRESATGFHAQNITFRNYYNTYELYLQSQELAAKTDGNTQAVACLVDADMCVFDNVIFTGYHDTLYARYGRQVYNYCHIEGRTDYVFGYSATAYFNESTFKTLGADGGNNGGYVAATRGCKTGAADAVEYGYVFYKCYFIADTNVVEGTVSLARAWGEYMTLAFIECDISSAYSLSAYGEGVDGKNVRYEEMSGVVPDPERIFEYGNTGAGALTNVSEGTNANLCTILTAERAADFMSMSTVFAAQNGGFAYSKDWDGNAGVELPLVMSFDGLTEDEIVNGNEFFGGNIIINEGYHLNGNSVRMDVGSVIYVKVQGTVTVTWFGGVYGTEANGNIIYADGYAQIEIIADETATGGIYIVSVTVDTGTVPDDTPKQTISIYEGEVIVGTMQVYAGEKISYADICDLLAEKGTVKAVYADAQNLTEYDFDTTITGDMSLYVVFLQEGQLSMIEENMTYTYSNGGRDDGTPEVSTQYFEFTGCYVNNSWLRYGGSGSSIRLNVAAGAVVSLKRYSSETIYFNGDAQTADENGMIVYTADVSGYLVITADVTSYLQSISVKFPVEYKQITADYSYTYAANGINGDEYVQINAADGGYIWLKDAGYIKMNVAAGATITLNGLYIDTANGWDTVTINETRIETVSGSVTFYSESGGDIVIATAGSQSSIREIHVTFSA